MRSDTRGFIHIVTLVLILLVLVGLGMAAGIVAGYLKNAPALRMSMSKLAGFCQRWYMT